MPDTRTPSTEPSGACASVPARLASAVRASLAFALATSAALALAACASAPPASRAQLEEPPPPELPPALEPGFEALRLAVEAGDDAAARAVLQGLLARRPTGKALEALRAYERILDGREAVRALSLSIACARGGDGRWRVALRGENAAAEPVELEPGPATMRVELALVDRAGNERRSVAYRPLGPLGAVVLAPGEPFERELGREAIALPRGALAARLRLSLELRSGEVRRGGRALPAMRLAVAGGEAVELDPSLAQDAEPATARRLVEGALEHGDAERLLRLAVRMDAEQAAAALDLAAERVDALPLYVLGDLAPSLRWLSGEAGAGLDAQAWRAWLETRDARRRARSERPRLSLPPPKP